MNVGLFSLNCASKRSIPLFEDRDVFSHEPDLFIEMTQEDYRDISCPSLFASVPFQYSLVARTHLNDKSTKQNLQIQLFQRTTMDPISGTVGRVRIPPKGTGKTLKNKAISLGLRLAATTPYLPFGYTKGAVWIKIVEPMPILCINMHLPMKKGQANLGLSLRVAALQMILGELRTQIDSTTTVLIGGDLNFRIDPQSNGRGMNQLTHLLSTDEKLRTFQLHELPIKPEDTLFTCKFRTPVSAKKKRTAKLFRRHINADPASNCTNRRATVRVPNNATLVRTATRLQTNCGALDRFPSRCDRFVYSLGHGVKMESLQNKGYPFLPQSDHNAIYATISLTAGQPTRNGSLRNLLPIDINDPKVYSGNNSGYNNTESESNNEDPRTDRQNFDPVPVSR